MKVLVTGNAGFIGFHTAKRLLERGDSVIGFDVVNDYYDPAIKEARLEILEETSARTSSVYGANTKMPFSEHEGVNHPLQFYAATKKANELMVHRMNVIPDS